MPHRNNFPGLFTFPAYDPTVGEIPREGTNPPSPKQDEQPIAQGTRYVVSYSFK